MHIRPTLTILAALLLALLSIGTAQAANRWDVLRWCTNAIPADGARCEGYLTAAVDLMTSDDFTGPRACFHRDTRMPDVRREVVRWLKENKTAPEKNGLALVTRAIRERFPCGSR